MSKNRHSRQITFETSSIKQDQLRIVGRLVDRVKRPQSGKMVSRVVHDMEIQIDVDASLNILGARFTTRKGPYLECQNHGPNASQILGLSLAKGFTKKAIEIFGGTSGCNHILTLLTDLPAAARQGWAFCYKFPKEEKQMASTGLVSTVQKMANDIKNTCMVWAEDSVVQREIAKGQLRDLPKRLYPKVKVVFMVCILTAQLFGLNARAQDNTSVSAPLSKGKKFAGEIGYQIHSLPLDGVALLGPSLTYQLTSTGALGTRMLLSPGDANERRVAVFWRFSWSRKYYVWLIEPHYSYLWQGSSGSQFSATGVAGGLQYKVSPDLLVGAIVGLERSGPFFPFGPIWDRPSFILSTTFQF